jgi:excisionase family DNA binding protein
MVAPAPDDVGLAGDAAIRVGEAIRSGGCVRLRVVGDSREVVVPGPALEALGTVLDSLAKGGSVVVLPGGAELSTQQAAQALNVSRPFLIKLLDAGEIAYRKVGAHRRVLADSLGAYMLKDYQQARSAADQLSAQAEELGLY